MSVAETKLNRVPKEPGTAPARSRAATRARLMDAGTELFAKSGLHGVTSAQVARAAGVATGTFYLHFRDKQALFRAIVFEALDELRARVRAAVEATDGSVEALVRARAAELLAFAEDNRALILVVFGPDAEPRFGEEVLEEIIPGVERGLRERAADRVHPAVAAQALVAMWSRVVCWWVEDPKAAPRDAVIETMTRLHPALPTRQPPQ